MSLYDRIFKPHVYTLADGTAVEEKRSRAPLILLVLIALTVLSVRITGFDLAVLVKKGSKFFDILKAMFPPNTAYLGKIWQPLWDTIKMSILGSFIGAVLAVPFAVAAASNIVTNRVVVFLVRLFLSLVPVSYTHLDVYKRQTMNDVNPDYVVVGEGRSYSLDTLTKATNLVMQGAKLIGANSDVSGPIENGIAPACRALIAPIEMATGKQAYFCGKPNPLMMRTGLKMLNCHSAEAVMVGDRMDTDVISGMESGMSTVLVLSGVSTRESLRTYAYRPSIVLDGVGDIAAMARAEKK